LPAALRRYGPSGLPLRPCALQRTAAMTQPLILANARVVLADEVIRGSVVVAGGRISAIDTGATACESAIDLEGDVLLPGLVELHTDSLEKHVRPRPGVHWPPLSAVVAHDRQLIGSGITTVLDALSAGDAYDGSPRILYFREMIESLATARRQGMLLADHHLHLRCEVSYAHVLDLFAFAAADPHVRLVSVMDHTPGQRQYTDVAKYRLYYQEQYGLDADAIDALIERQQRRHRAHACDHRRRIVEACQARGLPLASHDDALPEHVSAAARDAMIIAEFPTTRVAAEAARAHGLAVLMGAPNLVLGRSHSGNVAASSLAEAGLLDILSSDYVPASLLIGAFLLQADPVAWSLPAAVRTVTAEPAARVGFTDRGEIAPGRRADLVRVREGSARVPLVTAVWRAGLRVA